MQVNLGNLNDFVKKTNDVYEEVNGLLIDEPNRSLCIGTGVQKDLKNAAVLLLKAITCLKDMSVDIDFLERPEKE